MTTETTIPASVTDVRRRLVAQSDAYFERRQRYSKAILTGAPTDTDHDAYEGFATAGAYGLLIAGVLGQLEKTPGLGDTAAALADVVAHVMDGGDDCLEDANADLDVFASCQFCGEDIAESEPMVPTAQIPEEGIQMWAHAACHARVKAANAAPDFEAFMASERTAS
jgi:hypothetical protein